MPTEWVEMKVPGRPLGYAAPDSQGEVYRLGAASLALALVGQPTGMFCSMSLTGRGLAWGDTAGFLVFCAVMIASACLGLRARDGPDNRTSASAAAGWESWASGSACCSWPSSCRVPHHPCGVKGRERA